jgi:hypothetical protein
VNCMAITGSDRSNPATLQPVIRHGLRKCQVCPCPVMIHLSIGRDVIIADDGLKGLSIA